MTEKEQTPQAAVKKAAGGREDVKAESQKVSDKAAEARAKTTRQARESEPSPERGIHAHAPSTPDQASVAEQDVADAHTAPFRAVEGEYAPDNEIEATVRRMAGEGATTGEIAAYRADALAKLGDD